MDVKDIIINEDRQRKVLVGIEELANSIKEHGLINAIVIDASDNSLIAGERRLKALELLNIELEEGVHYRLEQPTDDLHRFAIELEENIKRESLTPPERAEAVREYHELWQKIRGKAVPHVGGGHSQADTAKSLGMSEGAVSDHIAAAKMVEVRPELKRETTLSAVKSKFKSGRVNQLKAEIARRKSENLELDLDEYITEMDASEFLHSLEKHSVDMILTDIPYNIDVFDSIALSANRHEEEWNDAETFNLDSFIESIDYALADDCHCFIFCGYEQSFQIYNIIKGYEGLSAIAPPFIWNKVNATLSRNPSLVPDRSYECIVHIRSGDPTYPERLGPDVITKPRRKDSQYPTEKPIEVLQYLIERGSLVGQLIVDPCCGSGSTGVAGLKAKRRVLINDNNRAAIDIARSRLVEALSDD